MGRKKYKKKEVGIEFIGTRSQSNAFLFEQMALESKDLYSRKYFESLAGFYRDNQGDSGKLFQATISRVN